MSVKLPSGIGTLQSTALKMNSLFLILLLGASVALAEVYLPFDHPAIKQVLQDDGGEGDAEFPGEPVSYFMFCLKGALSRNFSISLNSQNIYLSQRKPTNNGQ